MTIKCPHCGEVCESDEDIPVGQRMECPFCANKFYYGTDNAETPFCSHCGAKIPAAASFCPGCGRAVLDEAVKAIETMAEADSSVESGAGVVDPTSDAKSASHGYYQRLLRLIVVTLVLSAISAIISCIDIRECYDLGRVAFFLFEAAFLGIEIWLYVAVARLKSWARKSLIVLNLIGAVLFILGIGAGVENFFVFMLGIATCLIDLYCVYLCFQEEVVAVFKPDSELGDARAVVNTMHCFGFWIACVLWVVVCFIWVLLYHGTEAWDRDCSAAAVAGSSSARESLIDFTAVQLANQGYGDPLEMATEGIDEYIEEMRQKETRSTSSRSRGNGPKPMQIFIGLKVLGKVFVVLAGIVGGIVKFKGK